MWFCYDVSSKDTGTFMCDIFKKEFYSAIKWIVVIIVATMAYGNVAQNYYFTKYHGICRANKVTGKIEYLDDENGDSEWVSLTESEAQRLFRIDRKKRAAARSSNIKKRMAAMAKEFGDDLDDDDDV